MADYTQIGQPYGPNMNRTDSSFDPPPQIDDWNYAGEQGTQTKAGAMDTKPLISGRSLDNMWILSFIRSFNWKPLAQGFSIDGNSGNAEFSGVTARGTIVANGGFGGNIRTVSTNITLSATDYTVLVDCTTFPVTVTLPTASTVKNQIFAIKKIDSSSNALTIATSGGSTIDGVASKSTSTQYVLFRIQSNGTNWYVL